MTPAPTSPMLRAVVRQAGQVIGRSVVSQKQLESSRTRDDHFKNTEKDKIVALRGVGRGRLLVIVACGPSVQEVDLVKLRAVEPIDIMSINKPDPRIHPTTYWSFCDQSQYDRNVETFNSYKGVLITAWSVVARHPGQILVKVIQGRGFSKNLCLGFNIGRSSTYAAMQIAYWMNYDRVFIFGCDMGAVEGKLHFYGKNPDVTDDVRIKRFGLEAEHYNYAAALLTQEERQRYVFCSSHNRFDFVNKFARLHQGEAVGNILALANTMREQNDKK